jgi:hypothetical protein
MIQIDHLFGFVIEEIQFDAGCADTLASIEEFAALFRLAKLLGVPP